jgi:hydroxyacylglutathione hydrolase
MPEALSIEAVLDLQANGAIVIDSRDPVDFARGHLSGSVNVGLGGRYAEYTGAVVTPGTPIILVAEPDHVLESKVRLGRIGFDAISGYVADLAGALGKRPDLQVIGSRVTATDLASAIERIDDLQVVDIRQPGETADGTIAGAIAIPLTELVDRTVELDADRPTVVYCAGGYRSSIGSSYLAMAGFDDVSDLLGGYDAWVESMGSAA